MNEENTDAAEPNPFAPPPQEQAGADAWSELAELDEEFDRAKPIETGDLPDGKYQVRIQKAYLDKSQTGNPMLKYDLIVLSGPHAGRHLFKNSMLLEAALPFFKADLKALGISLPKFHDLPNHLNQMIDQTLEVTKKTKGEYSNVYFNKRIEILAGDGAGESDGPVPF
ncbi:MAG: DUF669 domain-containing protein [Planctomycetota bacterium]